MNACANALKDRILPGDYCRWEDQNRYVLVSATTSQTQELIRVMSREELQGVKADFIAFAVLDLNLESDGDDRLDKGGLIELLREPWPLRSIFPAAVYPELIICLARFTEGADDEKARFMRYCLCGIQC